MRHIRVPDWSGAVSKEHAPIEELVLRLVQVPVQAWDSDLVRVLGLEQDWKSQSLHCCNLEPMEGSNQRKIWGLCSSSTCYCSTLRHQTWPTLGKWVIPIWQRDGGRIPIAHSTSWQLGMSGWFCPQQAWCACAFQFQWQCSLGTALLRFCFKFGCHFGFQLASNLWSLQIWEKTEGVTVWVHPEKSAVT